MSSGYPVVMPVFNHGKGTKAQTGWFHGFHTDIWQAYALAVYAADLMDEAVVAGPHGTEEAR